MRVAARNLLLNRITPAAGEFNDSVNSKVAPAADSQTHRIVQLFRITDFDTILTDEMH